MVERVISGGQIGADIAGLRAAKRAGLPTGGYAAEGCKTLRGPNLELQDVYGLVDTGKGYAHRTEMNAKESDGTVRFAVSFQTAGERCTLKALLKHGKPYFDVPLVVHFDPNEESGFRVSLGNERTLPAFMRTWIIKHQIRTLNVAGNGREDIEVFVERYLERVL